MGHRYKLAGGKKLSALMDHEPAVYERCARINASVRGYDSR